MYLFKPILHTRCKQGFKVGYSFLYLCLFMFYLLYAIKRTGRPRTSPIMLLSCQEIAEARRLPPPPHLNPPHVAHLSHSSTPKRTKKPPCAQQESQCARRLKERIARMGAWENELLLLVRLIQQRQNHLRVFLELLQRNFIILYFLYDFGKIL